MNGIQNRYKDKADELRAITIYLAIKSHIAIAILGN